METTLNKMFADEKLSKLLQERGVVSQFYCYVWYENAGEYKLLHVDGKKWWPMKSKTVQAYHWSDLCLPENEFKIWPEYQDQRGRFAAMVIWPEQYELDWQFWLMSELTKQEGK